MARRANPGVGELSSEELADADETLTAGPETEDGPIEETPEQEVGEETESEETPTAEEEEERQPAKEPSSRRSGKKTPAEGKVNLDDLPDFRKYKAAKDQEVEQHKRQAAEERTARATLETRIAAQESAQQEAQAQALEKQLDDVIDPAQRTQIINQIAYSRFTALQGYDAEVRRTVQSEGLDPNAFPSQKYLGPDGRTRLQADVSTAKAKTLAKENEELKKSASPEAINAQVQAIVAKALQQAGLNHVDAGETVTAPRGGTSDEEKALWKRAQAGSKAAANEYVKRFGAG